MGYGGGGWDTYATTTAPLLVAFITLGDVAVHAVLNFFFVAVIVFTISSGLSDPEHVNWITFFITDVVNKSLNCDVWM